MSFTDRDSPTRKEEPVRYKEDGPSNASLNISNWDILLERVDDDDDDSSYRLSQRVNHVGNNRFEVLLNMHRPEFVKALENDLDSDSIVKKLVDIVTRQCVPEGRFLLSNESDASWFVLNYSQAVGFVREVLLLHNDSHLSSSSQEAHAPSAGKTTMDQGLDKKRGRRSTLLRRTMSESLLGESMGISKKKLTRIIQIPEDTIVLADSVGPLDVIFNSTQTQLISGKTGNNRLQVMIDMQKGTYTHGGISSKYRVVDDMLNMLKDSWDSKFWYECGPGQYAPITNEECEEALHAIFQANQPEQIQPPPAHPTTDASPAVTTSSSTTTTALPPTNTAARGRHSSDATNSSSRSLINNNSNNNAKQAPALSSVPPPAIKNMHTAAIESLQKKKKRQGLASRIRNLTESTAAGFRQISQGDKKGPTKKTTALRNSSTGSKQSTAKTAPTTFYSRDQFFERQFQSGSLNDDYSSKDLSPLRVSGRKSSALAPELVEDLLRVFAHDSGGFERLSLKKNSNDDDDDDKVTSFTARSNHNNNSKA